MAFINYRRMTDCRWLSYSLLTYVPQRLSWYHWRDLNLLSNLVSNVITHAKFSVKSNQKFQSSETPNFPIISWSHLAIGCTYRVRLPWRTVRRQKKVKRDFFVPQSFNIILPVSAIKCNISKDKLVDIVTYIYYSYTTNIIFSNFNFIFQT